MCCCFIRQSDLYSAFMFCICQHRVFACELSVRGTYAICVHDVKTILNHCLSISSMAITRTEVVMSLCIC